jgi:hypothetical protein
MEEDFDLMSYVETNHRSNDDSLSLFEEDEFGDDYDYERR